jgi:hypothetical protein
LICYVFYHNTIVPAQNSVKVVCGLEKILLDEFDKNSKNNITTQINNLSQYVDRLNDYAEQSNISIVGIYVQEEDKIIIQDDLDTAVLRHEECHRQQYYHNRSFGCENKFSMFLNEVEARLSGYGFTNCKYG